MESLIIIVLFFLISSLGGTRKRKARPNQNRPQTPARRHMQNMRDLAQQARQLISEVLDEDLNRRATNQRSTTRHARQNHEAEDECGYCTGEIEVESSLVHHTGAAAAPQDANAPCVDVDALQKQWGLSNLQNALLWQEILDKPLAQRRRGLR